jgi:hypothetical protein
MLLGEKADVTAFPKFQDYLYNSFPKVMHSRTIVGYMAAIGRLPEGTFKKSLLPGHEPLIFLDEWASRGCHLSAHGLMEVGKQVGYPPHIWLNRAMVRRFNDDPWDPLNMHTTSAGLRAPVVGVILLHALCDYNLLSQGLGEHKKYCPGGYEFEKAVYGNTARFIC